MTTSPAEKCRRELVFDKGLDDAPVHRRVNDEGRGQAEAPQPSDESLCLPMAERRLGAQRPALRTSAAQARHFRCRAGPVEEDGRSGSSRILGCLAAWAWRAAATSGWSLLAGQ